MKRTARVVAAAGVVGVVTALAGCAGGAGGAGPSDDTTITLYNGQHESTTKMLVSAFEKDTGIDVKVRSGEGPELANQIIQEGSASPADVIYTENSPALTLLSERGLLAKTDKATLRKIPSKYNSPNGDWVGVAARETVLVYDPRTLTKDELPHSILDLAKPRWKGKVGIAPTEGDFHPVVTAVRVLEGKHKAQTWLNNLADNAKSYNENEGIIKDVNRGNLAAGVINHYYWFRIRDEMGADAMHAKLYYFGHHDPGALLNISGAGVLKSSDHKKAAQRFLAFLAGKQGQGAIADSDDFEYTLNPDVQPNPALKPLDQLDPPKVSVAQLGDGSEALKQMRKAGLL
ncbi:MAG: iron ABC transporter substrate-binding protein [Streptosporangiaceae bacterium]